MYWTPTPCTPKQFDAHAVHAHTVHAHAAAKHVNPVTSLGCTLSCLEDHPLHRSSDVVVIVQD
jgi:hypothetical protein